MTRSYSYRRVLPTTGDLQDAALPRLDHLFQELMSRFVNVAYVCILNES